MKTPILVLLLVARLSAQEASPDAAMQETVDVQQAHYVAVEKELRAAPVDQLTPAQQAQRTWALDALNCYVTGREYGVDLEGLQGRVPWFRDPHGRLCAVGYMAWVSGEHALVERLAATRNHDWAVSLLEDPELAAWAARMGLTPLEIERIHAPVMHSSAAWVAVKPAVNPVSARAFNVAARNAEARPAPSSASGPRAAGAPSASGSPRAGAGADTGRAAQSNRTGGADLDPLTGGDEMDDWWLWWEINKSTYLLGPRSQPTLAGITGTGGASDRLAALRAAALPLLADALDDGQSIVRAAAATSLGRLGGEEAVDALQHALKDPAQSVREAALLALGATGSARAAELLLAIAQDGRDPGSGDELGPAARALAVTALGLARGRGLGAEFDPRVARLAQGPRPDVGVGTAALLYSRLAGTSVMDGLVDDLSHTRDVDLRLRCRVTESLRLAQAADLPPALDELGAPHADRRRSAAVALARAQTPFALPPLQTAFELESDPLTRGLLLVSVGSRGGPAARQFLIRQLEQGRALDRPWIALGLGLLARRDADDLARSALRQGLADARSSEAAGAWILGCGLAQDPQARGLLATALAQATDPKQRMFAALSLAMMRDEVSLAALRERLPLERSPLARAGLLLALGLQGRSADVPALLAELQTAIDPVLQGQVATALGESGNLQAAEGLAALLADPGALFPTAHAAALDALGLLLDLEPGFQLVAAAVDRNFAVFPDWLARALVSTSL